MQNVVHAHEILNHLLNSDGQIPLDVLQRDIRNKFGDDVRFTNCTEQIYTFDEIIQFLYYRGKIEMHPEGISAIREQMCDH